MKVLTHVSHSDLPFAQSDIVGTITRFFRGMR
jgi:hypothetical protein